METISEQTLITSSPEPTALTLLTNEPDWTESLITGISRVKNVSKYIMSLPKGAASWASTFGPIAVYYHPGSWLIVPVGMGAGISVSHEAMSSLAQHYPENTFFKKCHEHTLLLNEALNGILNDIGFAWNTINTIAVFIGGNAFGRNYFARAISPALATIPAVISRGTLFRENTGDFSQSAVSRHFAGFFRAGMSSTGVLEVLKQQDIITSDVTPFAFIVGTAIMGLVASLIKERNPKISLGLFTTINMVFENPSVAAAFMHFPLDIYAANHNHSVSEEFFTGVMILTGAFLLLSTVFSGVEAYKSYNQLTENQTMPELVETVVEAPEVPSELTHLH